MTAREEVLRELAVAMLAVMEAQHRAIDSLLAERAQQGIDRARRDASLHEQDFFPSRSEAWPVIEKGAQVMRKARAILGGGEK